MYMAKKTDPRYFGDKAAARERRRLFEEIEQLEGEIRLAGDTVTLLETQRRERREHKLSLLEARLQRPLAKLGLALASPQDAAQALLQKKLPGLRKAQRLAYRKLRQDLRRKEGLLDREGRMLPDAKDISPAARQQLNDLTAEQQHEQDRMYTELLEKARANRLSDKNRLAKQQRLQQGLAAKEQRLLHKEEALKKADGAYLKAQEKRQQARIDRLDSVLKEKQAQLLRSESQAEHHLPEDVCLRLEGLSMAFGGLKAVDNLSFDVKQGEIFGLIGPNGAGKTTVFNCITQFYKPTAGDIIYRTREGNVLRLNNYDVHKIITKGIVRTFQNVEVIGELSILDNLLIAAHPQYLSSLGQQIFNTRRVRQEEMVIKQRANRVLEYCGLSAIKDLPPVGQPYGVLKRVELARTLMAGANLIILDEPAAGLNDQETVELTRLIRQIQKDYGVTIFLVEHNMGLVMDLCDHICAISFGKKLAYGTPQQIQNDQLVQDAYLGTSDAQELEVIA